MKRFSLSGLWERLRPRMSPLERISRMALPLEVRLGFLAREVLGRERTAIVTTESGDHLLCPLSERGTITFPYTLKAAGIHISGLYYYGDFPSGDTLTIRPWPSEVHIVIEERRVG
jgi:hypothetical protein